MKRSLHLINGILTLSPEEKKKLLFSESAIRDRECGLNNEEKEIKSCIGYPKGKFSFNAKKNNTRC